MSAQASSSRPDARPARSASISGARSTAISGALAGGVALFVLLVGSSLLGTNGFLEAVHNGVTRFIPLDIFDAGIATFGSYAKGLLFIGISAALPVAGALLAVILVRLGG